jgi:hypothetical protein
MIAHAIAGNCGDNSPCCVDLTDSVAAVLCDVQVSQTAHRDGGWIVQTGHASRAAVPRIGAPLAATDVMLPDEKSILRIRQLELSAIQKVA